jgi:MFS family permease
MLIHFTFSIALLNMTSMKAGRVVLSLYALRLGAQPATIGLLASTFSVFPVLLSYQTGKLCDRFGARWLLTLGAVASTLGALAPAFSSSLTAVFVAAALSGLAMTFYNVTLQNLVGLLSTPETRAHYFSNFSLVLAIASFIGPLFVGFVIDHFGYRTAFMSMGVLAAIPALLLIVWGGLLPGGTQRHSKERSEETPATISMRDFIIVLVGSAIVQIALDMYQFYMPVYGHSIQLSAGAIGVTIAMFSAAAFVVRTIMPRLLSHHTPERILRYAFWLGAASFLVIPFFESVVALGVVSFIFGMGLGLGQPITMMMTFSNSPAGKSGEALGLRLTINQVTRLVGPALFGWIGSAIGLSAIFWANAVLLALGAMFCRTRAKKLAPS